MTHDSEILLLGSNLSEGESLRTICPGCCGGKSAERSLSITRNEGLVWQCFRAKCGVKGSTRRQSFSNEKQLKRVKPTWEGTTHELPELVADRVAELWRLDNPPHWYWTTDFGGRVAMSVRSPSDQHRGWVLRALNSTARTKALTFIEKGEGLSWYKTKPFAPTVVVEDIPSAIRASAHVNAVALLGTGVGLSRAQEIATYATRPIIIALDQDATSLSFRWAKKYSLLWGDVKILPLKKDLKDMTEEELNALFRP